MIHEWLSIASAVPLCSRCSALSAHALAGTAAGRGAGSGAQADSSRPARTGDRRDVDQGAAACAVRRRGLVSQSQVETARMLRHTLARPRTALTRSHDSHRRALAPLHLDHRGNSGPRTDPRDERKRADFERTRPRSARTHRAHALCKRATTPRRCWRVALAMSCPFAIL